MAFATIADMESRSRGAITAATHPFLQQELDAATKTIQTACGWHVAPELPVEFRRVSRIPSIVFLPAKRITGVTAAAVNGYPLDLSQVEVDPQTGETNIYGRVVAVDYTAGFDEVPADLVTLCLDLAEGGLSQNISREQAGSVAVTYARTSSTLANADRGKLSDYIVAAIP